MIRKVLLGGIAITILNTAFAQEDTTKTSPLTVSGSADAYYRYDFGETKANNLTSFTNSHNTFELGMASVKLNYKTSKVEMVADLGFGKRAQEFAYNDAGILAAVKQLYVSYSATNWLKFTAGSFATHVGYELVDPQLNRNYSMSYMFTNGPFFHTGVKAEASYKKSGFMLGIANATDYKYLPEGFVNKKAVIAQYSVAASDNFKAYLNFVSNQAPVDSSKSKQYDVVLTGKISDKFNLAYNGTVSTVKLNLGKGVMADAQTWWGSALYLNYDPTATFGLTLRSEYFSDNNQLKVYGMQSTGGSIFANTISANVRLDHFTLIPEFRLDKANKEIFTKSNNASTKSAASVLVAAVYSF